MSLQADVLIKAAEADEVDYEAKRQDAANLQMLVEAEKDLERTEKEKEAARVS